MTQQTTSSYPNTASILAIVGGILMVLVGLLMAAVSVFIIPHLPSSYFSSSPTVTLPPATIQQFASFVVGGLGAFGLICGIIVLVSAVMLQVSPSKWRTWGILILVFSVLSFLGTGGLVVGAILGIVGGAMALSWKPPTQ
jgi:type II secretory pathway component PulF